MKHFHRSLPLCLLDPRILALSTDIVVWELPAEVRAIKLGVAGSDPCEVAAPWPRLLLSAIRMPNGQIELRAVAVKRKGRVLPDTPTFHAPLMNIDPDGVLAVHVPNGRIDPRSIEEYETAILTNVYSATYHGSTMRLPGVIVRDSVSSYQNMREWRALAREGLNRFPGSMLTPRKQTVTEWLQEVESAICKQPNVFELVVTEGGKGKKEAAL